MKKDKKSGIEFRKICALSLARNKKEEEILTLRENLQVLEDKLNYLRIGKAKLEAEKEGIEQEILEIADFVTK